MRVPTGASVPTRAALEEFFSSEKLSVLDALCCRKLDGGRGGPESYRVLCLVSSKREDWRWQGADLVKVKWRVLTRR